MFTEGLGKAYGGARYGLAACQQLDADGDGWTTEDGDCDDHDGGSTPERSRPMMASTTTADEAGVYFAGG